MTDRRTIILAFARTNCDVADLSDDEIMNLSMLDLVRRGEALERFDGDAAAITDSIMNRIKGHTNE